MKRILNITLILASVLMLASCGKYEYKRDYRMAQDGKIYKTGTDELYTGTITDTSEVIITFEVVNGVKNGAFITYYTNGEYEKYGLIVNDMNTGEWKYFYPNGQLESIGSYLENKPDGKWVSYYPNGKIKTEGEYFFGEQHGIWKFYNDEGELLNVYIFGNGEFLEKLINS